MVAIDVGLGEIGGQARGEWVELERPGLQGWIAGEGLEEVPPVPASCFGSNLDGVEIACRHVLSEMVDQECGARAVVVDGAARAKNMTGRIHQTDGVGLAVDIDADHQRIGHHSTSLLWVSRRRSQRGERP
jgi:hypothetical protein